jgi:hypothetical protein
VRDVRLVFDDLAAVGRGFRGVAWTEGVRVELKEIIAVCDEHLAMYRNDRAGAQCSENEHRAKGAIDAIEYLVSVLEKMQPAKADDDWADWG